MTKSVPGKAACGAGAKSCRFRTPRERSTSAKGTRRCSSCRASRKRSASRELFAKDEGQNPTGSFKARGLGCGVSMAKHLGATALAAPSAGNAGGALAAYGARAGLRCTWRFRETCRVLSRRGRGARAEITLIDGTIADCGKWIGERAATHGWHDLSTLKEPYRVEGKKTMGYELAEQFGWSLPDVILYPTGGGTGLLGMAKAFDEMRALGWLAEDAPRPRFIAVQASGCAPMVDAFRSGAERAVIPDSPHTCASGLRVPSPIGDRWMLSVLQECGGDAIAIDDDELVEATRELGRAEGIFAAPEGGALVAALRLALGDGRVRPDERCVLFLTGYGREVPGVLRGRGHLRVESPGFRVTLGRPRTRVRS